MPISRIFRNEDFGYRTITVERPLRDEKGKPVLGEKGKVKGKPQPDSSLRDTENVPLSEDVETYFKREVLPHAPDAWIDHEKTKVGYEIPFNRHFYVFEPPRELAEIDADLKKVTDRIKDDDRGAVGMSFPRYPKYKDSGVMWLGAIPAHWRAMPIRLAARLESGHTPSRSHPEWWQDCTVPWISLADVWQIRENGADYIHETKEMVSKLGLANSSARVLPKGTVVLSRTASVGFSAIMGVDMATTQDFANWVCGEGLLPEFLLYVLRSMSGEFRRLMMGSTHNTIYMPDIQSLRFALPPIEEQSTIAGFIEHEAAKIDALVEEQKRLIELLKEKRQAVISQAVTKGLNPNVPMKDSGVEWLGKVPAHWEVGPMKRLWSVTDCKHITAEFVEDGIPLASIREVQGWQVALDDAKCTTPVFYEQLIEGGREPLAGDIIFTRNATVGEAALVPDEAPIFALGQDVCLLRKLEGAYSTPFMLRQLKSTVIERQLNEIMIGSTFKRINVEEIRGLLVCVPPPNEQHQIAAALAQQVGSLDELLDEAVAASVLLVERRSALISAAVTGKIDVRALAPKRDAVAA